MEKSMTEETVSQYYAQDKSRKAILSKDSIMSLTNPPKARYICRLYKVSERQELTLWATRLVYDHALGFAEDLCENFVEGYGEFKNLEEGVLDE
jgi:hypothetical protein